MADQVLTGLLVLFLSVVWGTFVADVATRTKLRNVRSAWCTEVHGGEVHGAYCVSSDGTAHPLPSYLE